MKRFDPSPRRFEPDRSRARPWTPRRFRRRWPIPTFRGHPEQTFRGHPEPRRRLRPVGWRSPVGPGPRKPPREGWQKFRRSKAVRAGAVVLAVAAFGTATWAVSRSPLLDVDHIEVTGTSALPVDAVIGAAGVRTGEPLLRIDTAEARARLEAVPWVDRAEVRRAFPNRVRIRLSERAAAASVARAAGGFALLDPSGRVLADQADRPPDLPEVLGAGEVPAPGQWLDPAARPALAVVMALPEALRRQVTTAENQGGTVALRLGEREVRFGPPEDLEAKAAALEALLDHLGSREVAFVDVRVPSAPVVGPIDLPDELAGTPAVEAERDPAGTATAPRN